MVSLLESPALWGLVGGVGYAGTNLSTALWGGTEVQPRAVRLAVAQFVIAVFLSPFAAHAGTPVVRILITEAPVAPTAMLIGLSFNAVWPMIVERGFLRKLISDMARGLADRLSPGE